MKKRNAGNPDALLFRGVRAGLCGLWIAATCVTGVAEDENASDPDAERGFRPPHADSVLHTLKPHHPRLMLDAEAIRQMRKWIGQDPVAERCHKNILTAAEQALKEPAPTHHLRDGRRLLYVSGEVMQRVTTLSLAHRLTGRKDFVERAWLDLDAVAGFKDWNPAHFLDTAVMTCAVAIGYDWLWDQWTPPQRARLREAIVTLGLQPAMEVYRSGKGWPRVDYNWNQVCNGGIALGALAVAKDEPQLASQIVAHAVASIPIAMQAYAPDGAGKEGAGYWAFGTQYNVLLLASLESALGTDFGLGRIDGFRQSGIYQIYMSGAGRMSFDFGDCRNYTLSTPQHFWMGRRYGIPAYSSFRYNALRERPDGGVWDLLWFDAQAAGKPVAQLPLDRYFSGAECVSMRDSWMDTRGFTVALQGGANDWTHRHYDLGSFILEADGVRWIIDSGKEGETYQRHANHTPRDHFYRVRAEAHNTLVIDPDEGPGQAADGVATFTSFESSAAGAKAVLDLSRAYPGQASQITRTFELTRGKSFTVTDDITCRKASEIHSSFHTEAEVELSPDKRQATLGQAGKSLVVHLLDPEDAVFEVLPAEPGPASPNPAKQASNDGRRKLTVILKDIASPRIQVRFTPAPSKP